MSHLKTTIRAIGSPLNIVFCGLDYAGKTAMYIRLKTGKFVSDLKPTLSSTMDSVPLEDDDELVKTTIIDLGGQKALRDLWESYIEKSDVIIYVVDAHDSMRFDESKLEFQSRVVPLATKIPCIIVCNKFDLIKAEAKVKDYSELISEVEARIHSVLEVPKNENFALLVTSQKTGYGLPKVTRLIRELVTKREF
jgi:small GTP-binding protein